MVDSGGRVLYILYDIFGGYIYSIFYFNTFLQNIFKLHLEWDVWNAKWRGGFLFLFLRGWTMNNNDMLS